MARIKVTGYIEPGDDEVDLDDPTGLTADAFDTYGNAFLSLDDVKFELVDED